MTLAPSQMPTSVQVRILKFFKEQPQAVETARGMASWVDSELELIQEALSDLVHRRWLWADETASVTGYTLTQDERHLAQIHKVLEGVS